MIAPQEGSGPSEAGAADPETVTVEDALEFAVRSHRGGQPELAATLYRRILEASPDHPDALHFYGLLHHQCGQSAEGIALILRAIELAPGSPAPLNNLGNILAEQKRYAEAASAYEAVLQLQPDHVDALSNFGAALRRLDRVAEAEAIYRQAIALDPRHREAHDNLGRLLSRQGRIDEAIVQHVRALELEPRNAETRRLLAATYAAAGETDNALAILRDWLADEPGSPSARHLYAAVSGEGVPERAGDDYVRGLFDGFADSFDRTLARLSYRAPEVVAHALQAALAGRSAPVVLDAGCGTGLCGPLLAPMSERLVGIDLSSKMLDRAWERGTYAALEAAELTAYLESNPESFDAVVSADTLCYFGDLHRVIRAAAGALRDGGILAFTVEKGGEPDGVRIHTHGRYSHSVEHVRSGLSAAGLALIGCAEEPLRVERGRPVVGYVVTARRIAG